MRTLPIAAQIGVAAPDTPDITKVPFPISTCAKPPMTRPNEDRSEYRTVPRDAATVHENVGGDEEENAKTGTIRITSIRWPTTTMGEWCRCDCGNSRNRHADGNRDTEAQQKRESDDGKAEDTRSDPRAQVQRRATCSLPLQRCNNPLMTMQERKVPRHRRCRIDVSDPNIERGRVLVPRVEHQQRAQA